MGATEKLIAHIEKHHLWHNIEVIQRNDFVCIAGSTTPNLYYIEKGSLRLFVSENQEHTIRFGYEGNIITALDSFVTGRPTVYFLQALKSTTIKVIAKPVLYRFMEKKIDVAALWTRILEELIVQQLERERDLMITSPFERYQRVLKRSPELFQHIPSKYIANYLRMTPETLSRIMKEAKCQGD